jgi:hypothetical protein
MEAATLTIDTDRFPLQLGRQEGAAAHAKGKRVAPTILGKFAEGIPVECLVLIGFWPGQQLFDRPLIAQRRAGSILPALDGVAVLAVPACYFVRVSTMASIRWPRKFWVS